MRTVNVRCSFIENGVRMIDKVVVTCNIDRPNMHQLQDIITKHFEGKYGMSDVRAIGVSCIVKY